MKPTHLLRMTIVFIFIASGGTFYANKAQAQAFDVSEIKEILRKDNKITWHGYYEFEYWDSENRNNTFDAHKITTWMGVQLNKRAYFSAEIEYEHAPKLPKERAGGSGEINLDSAQLRLMPFDDTVAYFGVFYVPFGIEYYSYPGHKNKLVSRPKVMKSGGVIPGTWSDVGFGVNQVIPNVAQVDVFLINGDARNGGVSRDSSQGGNDSKTFGARVMFDQFIEGLNIGASYAAGKWDEENENKSARFSAHLRVDSDIITQIPYAPVLIAEYVSGADEMDSSVTDKDKNVYGYYAQLSSSVHPKLEVVARYGEYNNDEDKTDNTKTETSVGLVWHMMEGVQAKVEYQWNEEEGVEQDNNQAAFQLVAFW